MNLYSNINILKKKTSFIIIMAQQQGSQTTDTKRDFGSFHASNVQELVAQNEARVDWDATGLIIVTSK